MSVKRICDMHKLKVVRGYEGDRVSEEQSDTCSTSDLCVKINHSLSEASKAYVHVYETHGAL